MAPIQTVSPMNTRCIISDTVCITGDTPVYFLLLSYKKVLYYV